MPVTTIPEITETPDTNSVLVKEPTCQVVLYNDDVNTFQYVANTLQKVFGHPRQLAEKLARAVHEKGKEIVEVEPKPDAMQHKGQLQAARLTAEVQEI